MIVESVTGDLTRERALGNNRSDHDSRTRCVLLPLDLPAKWSGTDDSGDSSAQSSRVGDLHESL